ncbi:MAG: tail fiber domain-containing protein [Bacteroidetes bacterium]|nr:tail fiber domain-containing protein [Bacteroidota bacterium]
MKKRIITSLFLMGAIGMNAQQGATGPAISATASTAQQADHAWYRGGNNPGGPAGTKNIFGTKWNSPIFTQTAGASRMRLNGNTTYSVNGYTQPRNGYLLLGEDGTATFGNLYGGADRGAFSLLHLNGPGGFVQELGYRNWMQTGITFTSNNDLMYVGHRKVGAGPDLTEAVIQWSDNGLPGALGPDVMSFRFTGGNGTASGGVADLGGQDNDGREIVRVMGSGNVGIGPRFVSAGTLSISPTSRLHQHNEDGTSSWYQITNQYLAGGAFTNPGPTTVTAADGLRLGIFGNANPNANGIAMLYNQELRPLLFSTNANTTTATATLTQERVRIMSYSTPTALLSSGYGVNNPSPGTNPDATRVSISHNPGAPLTRPLSLLHLGYNNDALGSQFGHRPWMDVGTFTSQNSNNMYVGLKAGAAGPEAAINFGGNTIQVMRFTHTKPTSPSTTTASLVSGLEIAEMWSNGNEGRTGFGDIAPLNTVHIKDFGTPTTTPGGGSGLRFEHLNTTTPTIPNPGLGLLAVDANGDVIYVDGALTPGSGLGNACASGTPSPLASSWEIPMNNFNFRFADAAGTVNDGVNFVGIGTSCTPAAKLEVIRGVTTNSLSTVIANRVENADIATNTPYIGFGYATYGIAKGTNRENAGVYGTSENAMTNAGVRGNVSQTYAGASAAMFNTGVSGVANNGRTNVGVSGSVSSTNPMTVSTTAGGFTASGSKLNYGVQTNASSNLAGAVDNMGTSSTANTATGGTSTNNMATKSTAKTETGAATFNNIGTFSTAQADAGSTTVNNVGVVGIATLGAGATATNSIGIYGDGAVAGYFTGVVLTSQLPISFSDQKIKTNVNTIESGLTLLNKLNPVTYDYKIGEYPELNLSDRLQYGFIAQEVEQVIPELVTKSTKPEFKDAEGNVISKGGEYKGISYSGLIPVLTKSIQEQQVIIEKLIKEVAELKEIAKVNPANTSTTAIASVELSDVKSIVLDQNTPNPFAEQTSITYNLTDGVQKAQMLFYNVDGKLINSVELDTKQGRGQLNVFASDLSNGMYTYTLVVDGIIIDSKRMVKSN